MKLNHRAYIFAQSESDAKTFITLLNFIKSMIINKLIIHVMYSYEWLYQGGE